jgi:hypothetical protein
MLKIWLTWLQPRLGVFGTALVLSNPLCSYAATKPVTVTTATKLQMQPSQWSSIKSTGTTIEQELLNAIPGTPDLAVRQLAIDSMTTSGMRPNIPVAKTPQNTAVAKVVRKSVAKTAQANRKALGKSVAKTPQANRKALASIVSPAPKFKKLSTKATKPQQVKQSVVAAALTRAINPQNTLPVPGLFIGNTEDRVSKRISPNLKPTSQPLSSASEIGAPTPLSAMMAAKTAVDPFPVVRPELMRKLQGSSVVANVPGRSTTPQVLNPIAVIPNGRTPLVATKAIDLKANAPHSLDPIAAIPAGLQRLLGNNLNSKPTIAVAPIATATATKPSSLVALKQFVTPTNAISTSVVSTNSLQLATAQAYTSVPKFDIPGETILSVKPTVNLLANRPQNNLKTTVVVSKSNFVPLMSDRQLTPATKQSWMEVNQQSNLGGLILGSQSLSTVPKTVGLLPINTLTNSASMGLPARDLADFH